MLYARLCVCADILFIELVDLGTKLGVETDQLNRDKLIENIRDHLRKNEHSLKDDPLFAPYFTDTRRKYVKIMFT